MENTLTKEQKWWLAFDDKLMSLLATDLLQQNLDIKIALARVSEARALHRFSRSTLFPIFSLKGTANKDNTHGQTQSITQGGFDATWEVDIFAKNRSTLYAACARLKSAKALAKDTRRIIIADLMRAIIDWRKANETLKETQNLLEAQSNQVSLFQSRAQAGLIDSTLLERAKAQRAQTATQIPLAKAAAKAAQYEIEHLLGKAPNSLSSLLAQHQDCALNAPTPNTLLSIPTHVISMRPDLKAAQHNLVAAKADFAKARADLWPTVSLAAFFGIQKTSNVALTNPVWSLANSVTAPLINFGGLRAALHAASARVKSAAFEYEKATLLALKEAHTALSDYLNAVNATSQQADALAHREKAVSLAYERFEHGLTDMISLTTAQAELEEAALALIEQKATAAVAFIRFRKSIGL